MKEISYVLDGVEVVLTGRVAERELSTTRRSASKSRVDELVEVTPKDDELGSWKKFVRMKELYILKEADEE